MSVQTNGGSGQDPTAGGPQSGQDPTAQQGQQGQQGTGQQQPQGQAPGQQQGGQFDPSTIEDPALRAYVEAQQAELRRARGEAANYRTQFQGLQRQNETAEQAAQREAQERQERLDRLERENRELRVTQAMATAAKDAHDPSVVAAMIGSQVTLDESGKPTNLEALVSGLRQSHPFLFKVTPGGGDAGAGRGAGGAVAPAGTSASINDLIRGGRGIPVR